MPQVTRRLLTHTAIPGDPTAAEQTGETQRGVWPSLKPQSSLGVTVSSSTEALSKVASKVVMGSSGGAGRESEPTG